MQVLRKAFKEPLNPVIADFINSIEDDKELIGVDLSGSMAHCEMLAQQGLITEEQALAILGGLRELADSAKNGGLVLQSEFEDVHMNVEKKLECLIGEDALRLHTARSRNDQVALDLRLYVMEQVDAVCKLIEQVEQTLKQKAIEYPDVVMPGYTHLQRAQPVFFAHALAAFSQMLARDKERFQQAKERASVSPLGAGAQAGTGLDINPSTTAALLGMSSTFKNSIDAVMDRDFAADFLMAAALCATHLSQICETLIIWNTSEFGFVQFADSVTTTSSLMPQKKNPDPLEIVRAKSGTATGELVNLLVVLKGLPLGYNRDLQETKPPVIRVAKCLKSCLAVVALVISAMEACPKTMKQAAADPNLMATDLVEYLVMKGVPFRTAHESVAGAVQFARDADRPLSGLSLAELKTFSSAFEEDAFQLFDPTASAFAKTSPGGAGSKPE